MGNSILRVEQIDVHYGDFHALWDVSLDVEEAQVVSIIGANGAGKSTLLNTIAGVKKPSRGTVQFRGNRINGLPPYQAVVEGISMVPEGRRVFPRLTVLENLEIGSYTPKARRRKNEALKKIYELFPVLEERRNQLSSTLSGGEQQMLAIGRALMSWPQLILLDEISLGLAPVVIKQIYQKIKQINAEGITALLVEQDIKRSLKAAHKVYIMQSGRISLEGRPESLSQEEIRKAYFGLSDLNVKPEAERERIRAIKRCSEMLADLKDPIMNGLLLGGLYGIVGIGMSMIFGIVRVVNLAHGDLVILASYLSFVTLSIFKVSPLLTLALVIPAMFLIGFIVQYYLVNRVLGKDMNPPLLVAFGLSIILQNLLLLIFTPDARALVTNLSIATLPIGSFLNIPVVYLVDFIVSLATIFLLSRFFSKTYLGKAIRAASDDEGAAELMGINAKRIYAWAMAIAGGTAAIAGVLVGMTFTFYPHTGPDYLIIAFGVVIIGGLGSLIGTFMGGLILGLAQILGAHFLGPGFQLISGYIILLVVLAFKPTGLFSKG